MNMLPTLNGKSFLDCNEDDLQALIDNPDYRENEYIDYKRTFSFLEMDKNNPKRISHIAEFRSDVCAFANADGGYLLFGISDKNGMAKELVGVDIDANNTDKFELDRKNNLSPILPKIPSVQFKFISLNNGKYVVVLFVHRDAYAPYVHIENERDYKVYKRIGNGKSTMSYMELKIMFNQSLSLDAEVLKYRQQRIDYYRSQEDTPEHRYSQFLLFHIIPDTFVDSSYNKNLYMLSKQKPTLKFSSVFYNMRCSYMASPNVDGLRYAGDGRENDGLLNNNGIAECFFPAHMYFNDYIEDSPFMYKYAWDDISPMAKQYIRVMQDVIETKRIFLCISILGCKNTITNYGEFREVIGRIDRDSILCNPVVIEDLENEDSVDIAIKRLQIEFYLALGIRRSEELDKLIAEVSKNDYD